MNYDTVDDEPIYEDYKAASLNSVCRIGYVHTNHCEDSIYVEESSNDKIVCGVFDGCSSGEESHLASGLLSRLFKKAVADVEFSEFAERISSTTTEFGYKVLRILFEDVKEVNRKLRLEYNELLSTMLVGVYSKSKKNLFVGRVGDGLISVNKNIFEFYEDHKSDYIGYHLNMETDEFYMKKVKKLEFDNVSSFSLSTDGIYSFRELIEDGEPKLFSNEIIDYILHDQEYRYSKNWIMNKIENLEKRYELINIDDIGIVVYEKLKIKN